MIVMDILGKAKELAQDGLDKAKDLAGAAKDKAVEGAHGAGDLLGGLKDKAVEMAENVTHKDLNGDGKVGTETKPEA